MHMKKTRSSYDKTGLRFEGISSRKMRQRLKKVEDVLALPMMVTSGFESGSKQTQRMREEILKTTDSERKCSQKIRRCLIFYRCCRQEAREELVKETSRKK